MRTTMMTEMSKKFFSRLRLTSIYSRDKISKCTAAHLEATSFSKYNTTVCDVVDALFIHSNRILPV